MRKILIPTDFSDNAMNALKYACKLFKHEITKFYIMHAFQDEIFADNTLMTQKTLDEVISIISSNSQTQLENILEQIKKNLPNPRHTFSTISSNNMLMFEADKLVDKKNIDIIVMGTRGKTNDRKLTFGSHTLQVLKYVQCPILAIPEGCKYIQPKHILFPTNYMIPYKRRELKLLSEMASPYKAKIDMLYISKRETLSKRKQKNRVIIKEELCKNKINFKTVSKNNITNAIYTYIKENDIDMLVMVNTKHSFLENILYKSTIDKMSLYLNIPFLAMQNM